MRITKQFDKITYSMGESNETWKNKANQIADVAKQSLWYHLDSREFCVIEQTVGVRPLDNPTTISINVLRPIDEVAIFDRLRSLEGAGFDRVLNEIKDILINGVK